MKVSDQNKHIVLQTKALEIGYRNKKSITSIAKDISIELGQGQLIGLVGANGIGKSTLLRTLATIQEPLNGIIELNGEMISSLSAVELAKTMSLVLTEQLVSKNLTVFELIALGRQPYTNWIGQLTEKDQQMVNYAIEQTNLKELQNRKCFELSDGQMQKVMIARALAQDTNIIILDEPTTHLDMYHKAYILKLLKDIAHNTNKTILFSSHEIELAIQLCDRMLVMTEKGVFSNEPCQLIELGIFETLFPKNLIQFDQKTGSFKVKG